MPGIVAAVMPGPLVFDDAHRTCRRCCACAVPATPRKCASRNVLNATGGRGVDIGIEAAGAAAAIEEGLTLVNPQLR